MRPVGLVRVVQKASPTVCSPAQAEQTGHRQRSDYDGQGGQRRSKVPIALIAGTTAAGTALLAYGFFKEDRTAKCQDLNIGSPKIEKRVAKIWSATTSFGGVASGKIMESKKVTANTVKANGVDNTIEFENRIRQYSTPDQTFNYFAKYLVSQRNYSGGISQWVMMSPMDLFNALTPENATCINSQAVMGAGNYISVESEELQLMRQLGEMMTSPIINSTLNAIGKNGLITYNDFCFLLTILSTPRRYMNTAFELFDINGDGLLDAKEFAFVCSKLAYNPGGFGDYDITALDQTYKSTDKIQDKDSGLLNLLFGKDRNKKMTLQNFSDFIYQLQDEMIELEFREYDKGETGRISELDLACFLLKHAKVPSNTVKKMIKRVKNTWPNEYKNRGVSLPSFKNLYQALAGGEDLQRAMYFLDQGEGVDYEEFQKIFKWVSKQELSDHVARVLFVLFDDDMDGKICTEDLQNVLFNWRKARGFEKLAVNATMGHKKKM